MKNTIIPTFKKYSAYAVVAVFALTPLLSFAETTPGNPAAGGQPKLPNPLGNPGTGDISTINLLVPKIIQALLEIGIVVIVLAFMWAGFKYVTALGDEKKVGEAHQIFKYTAIGALVLLGANVLATVLKGTLDAIQGKP